MDLTVYACWMWEMLFSDESNERISVESLEADSWGRIMHEHSTDLFTNIKIFATVFDALHKDALS